MVFSCLFVRNPVFADRIISGSSNSVWGVLNIFKKYLSCVALVFNSNPRIRCIIIVGKNYYCRVILPFRFQIIDKTRSKITKIIHVDVSKYIDVQSHPFNSKHSFETSYIFTHLLSPIIQKVSMTTPVSSNC